MHRIPERLYGLIGYPLGHSLSPLVHNRALALAEYPGVYLAWPTLPHHLEAMMAAVRLLPVAGLSVTIPHKEAVAALCDDLTEQARQAGAVNTLYWQEGRLWGDNTDISGFMAPLRALPEMPRSALVLGAGGVSRAALLGLRQLGVEQILVTSRSLERTRNICQDLDCVCLEWEDRVRTPVDLLVNATPLGMQGGEEEATPWPRDAFGLGMVAYDLVYNPLRTRFLRQAEAAGCRIIQGLEMFLGQAQGQFERWTSLPFPLDAARDWCIESMTPQASAEAGSDQDCAVATGP